MIMIQILFSGLDSITLKSPIIFLKRIDKLSRKMIFFGNKSFFY